MWLKRVMSVRRNPQSGQSSGKNDVQFIRPRLSCHDPAQLKLGEAMAAPSAAVDVEIIETMDWALRIARPIALLHCLER